MKYDLQITKKNWEKNRRGNNWKKGTIQAFSDSYPSWKVRFHSVGKYQTNVFIKRDEEDYWINAGKEGNFFREFNYLYTVCTNKNIDVKFPWKFSMSIEKINLHKKTPNIVEAVVERDQVKNLDPVLPRWCMEKLLLKSKKGWNVIFSDEERFRMDSDDHGIVYRGNARGLKTFLRTLYFSQAYRDDSFSFPIKFPIIVNEEVEDINNRSKRHPDHANAFPI